MKKCKIGFSGHPQYDKGWRNGSVFMGFLKFHSDAQESYLVGFYMKST